MSAPRVPPGWTREAADLVWATWVAALNGREPLYVYPRASLSTLLSIPGMRVNAWASETFVFAVSESPAARLRAWAAVGAPVLAPAEDGRPSLAEWIHVCESSALGRPLWLGLKALFSRPNQSRIDCEVLADGSATVTDWSDCANQWRAVPCATPAELRALLDSLAVPS